MSKIYKTILYVLLIIAITYTYTVRQVYSVTAEVPDFGNITIIHEEVAVKAEPTSIKGLIQETFGANWRVAYAVMMAESSGNYKAIGYNKDSRKTLDRGLFQINSYWHSEVSDSCAYNIKCNIKEAYRISSQGTNWNQWYSWRDNKHLRFM